MHTHFILPGGILMSTLSPAEWNITRQRLIYKELTPLYVSLNHICYPPYYHDPFLLYGMDSCVIWFTASSWTYWGRDKVDIISQTMLWNVYSSMEIFKFWLKCHWSLPIRVQLTILQHWYSKWLGDVQTASHYLNQWWLVCRITIGHPFLVELSARRRGRWQSHLTETIAEVRWRASARVWGLKLQPRFGWTVLIRIITRHARILA